MRLIDAVALERIIQEQVGKCMIKVFNPSVNLILQDIRNAPTIEDKPVKHGHWIEHPDDIFPLESTIECSVCGEQENVNIHNDNFCPNCGARMGGDIN